MPLYVGMTISVEGFKVGEEAHQWFLAMMTEGENLQRQCTSVAVQSRGSAPQNTSARRLGHGDVWASMPCLCTAHQLRETTRTTILIQLGISVSKNK